MSEHTDQIIEALSWSETFEDGRLGYEKARAILAEHDRQVRAEAWDEGRAAGREEYKHLHQSMDRTYIGRRWQPFPNPYRAEAAER